jgi:peptide/nickel transport system permease protein
VRFLLRRMGFFAVTLWVALTLNFLLPRLMPGDPAEALMARFRGKVPLSSIKPLLAEFGIDTSASLWSQYVTYLKNMLTGNWGISTTSLGEPVSTLIRQALPWTIGLIGVTTVMAFVAGTLIGIVAGWKRGGKLDGVLPTVFVITSSLPYFWVALLLILVFSVWTGGWLPNDNSYDVALDPGWNAEYIGNVLQHALLPAATILITSIGGWILTMRNNMITTLAEDYVRMGRAKGLSNRKIMMNYAARNAFLPNLSGFAMSLGYVISGAILVEYVFNYQGLGYMLYNATINVDYPLMQALFLLITVAVLLAVLVCDFATFALDPRARTGG